MTTMTEPTTHTLDVPGAVLTYDVRARRDHRAPLLLMIGSPMGAGGFGTLAGPLHRPHRRHLRPARRRAQREGRPGQPVDARAARRRPASDHRGRSAPARSTCSRAAAAPSTRSRSSRRIPERRPDARRARAAARRRSCPTARARWPSAEAIHETYQQQRLRRRHGAVHRRRRATEGRSTADFVGQPAPDPAMFGLPTEDDGNRTDPLLGQNIITCTHYEPDFDALRAASTRIVARRRRRVGGPAGAPRRVRRRRAARHRAPCIFPSDHGGFLGGEYGQAGDPDAFAAKLREVLTNA